ncbi:F0F1 ATP synthase subunit B [Patescibacteria group bacterium]|nr:F0F1 ATP synthase subunit B [Patescibacteria group bacterium]
MNELLSGLGINGKLLFAQAVNFLIVLWLLNRFVFKKLIAFIEKRKERIQEGIELTERAEREMERIGEARERELRNAREQATNVVAKAETTAKARGGEILIAAKEESEQVKQQAKEDAERAKQDAVKEATGEISKTALLFAEKVLSRNLTAEDEERMTKEVFAELDKR